MRAAALSAYKAGGVHACGQGRRHAPRRTASGEGCRAGWPATSRKRGGPAAAGVMRQVAWGTSATRLVRHWCPRGTAARSQYSQDSEQALRGGQPVLWPASRGSRARRRAGALLRVSAACCWPAVTLQDKSRSRELLHGSWSNCAHIPPIPKKKSINLS